MFCPHECPHLHERVGDEFKELYEKYEREGRARRVVKAKQLFFAILDSQIETGTPYMMYKGSRLCAQHPRGDQGLPAQKECLFLSPTTSQSDACNLKSNQKNLGVIQCSNLCTEIVEYTAPDEVAVCNLASIALPKFVNLKTHAFDFQQVVPISRAMTNLAGIEGLLTIGISFVGSPILPAPAV